MTPATLAATLLIVAILAEINDTGVVVEMDEGIEVEVTE